MPVPQGGVQLVVQGYDEFILKLGKANDALDQFSNSLNQTSQQSAQAGQSAQKAQADFRALGVSLAAAGTAGLGMLGAIGLSASRIEELGAILEITRINAQRLAEANGDLDRASSLTSQAVQEQVQGVRELHLSGLVANETVAQLIRYNLDWQRSTELARLAQDAATFAMQDSSVAVEGLVRGITTLNPRVLRTYGLMINLNVAYENWAQANGVAVKDMTVAQRQQAAFNEVLAQAPTIAGAYEAAMGTAAKQIRSIQTDVADLAEEFGEHLTPALDAALPLVRDLIQSATELSDPMQVFILATGGSASALAGLTGTAIVLLPQLAKLRAGFIALSGAMGVSSLALLGAGGLIVGLVGLVAAMDAVDNARQAEAAAILEASDSYEDYRANIEVAELASYELSESLYEIAKASQEAGEGLQALELQNAQDEIQELTFRLINTYNSFSLVSTATGEFRTKLDFVADGLRNAAQSMNAAELAILADEEAMYNLAISLGYSETQAYAFAEAMKTVAQVQREVQSGADGVGESMARMASEAGDAVDKFDAVSRAAGAVVTAAQEGAHSLDLWQRSFIDFVEAQDEFEDRIRKVAEKGADQLIAADQRANEARERAREQLHDALIGLEEDHADSVSDILQDLADIDVELQRDILDAVADYWSDRAELGIQFQQDLEDAERDLNNALKELAIDRLQNIEDAEREYAQKREDLARDLVQDLEDIERDHQRRMDDLQADYYSDLEDLAQEHANKLLEIENIKQQKLDDLEEDFEEKRSDTRLKFLREALERLENSNYADEYAEFLRSIFLGEIEVEPHEVGGPFRELYAALLEELANIDEDYAWAQEDITDDIAREQAKRLENLEGSLEEEQAAREAAYQEQLAQEQERFEREKAEKERQYNQRLQDLEIQHQRELAEIEREYQRQQEALRIKNQREREEIARRYQERLDDLDRQLAEEKARLEAAAEEERQRLQEQLQDERQNYSDRETELRAHYAKQLLQIQDAKSEERAKILAEMDKQKLVIIDELSKQSTAFADAYQGQREDLERHLFGPGGMYETWKAYFDWLNAQYGGNSPSKWFEQFGKDQIAGYEKGFDLSDIQANIQAAFDVTASGMRSVMPAEHVSLPPGIFAGSQQTTNQTNLSVTANYPRYQSEASLLDDLAGYEMTLRNLRR